jgi:hypothetical protein
MSLGWTGYGANVMHAMTTQLLEDLRLEFTHETESKLLPEKH